MNDEQEDVKVASNKQYVRWPARFEFETRTLTVEDLKKIGAQWPEDVEPSPVEWNAANGWLVPREDLPLDDVQLGLLVGRDGQLMLA